MADISGRLASWFATQLPGARDVTVEGVERVATASSIDGPVRTRRARDPPFGADFEVDFDYDVGPGSGSSTR